MTIAEEFIETSSLDIEGPEGSDRALRLNQENLRSHVYAALNELPDTFVEQNSGLKIEWGPRTLTESWLWDPDNNRLLIRRPFIIDEDTATLWRDKILEAYHVLKMAER